MSKNVPRFTILAFITASLYYFRELIFGKNKTISPKKVPREIAEEMRTKFNDQIKPLISDNIDSTLFKFPIIAFFNLAEFGNHSNAAYIFTYFICLDDRIIDVENYNIKKSFSNKLYLAFQAADDVKNAFGEVMVLDKQGNLKKISSIFGQLQKSYFAEIKSKIDRLKPVTGNTEYILNDMENINDYLHRIEQSKFLPHKIEFELTQSVFSNEMVSQKDQLTLFTNVSSVFGLRINGLSDDDNNCIFPPGCKN